MSAQIVSINSNVTATGPVALRDDGLPFSLSLGQFQAYPLQSLQVVPVSGTIATLNVTLEVSLNGTDWAQLGSAITNINGGIITAQIQFPFPNVRANVNTLTGTAPAIKVMLGVGRFFQG